MASLVALVYCSACPTSLMRSSSVASWIRLSCKKIARDAQYFWEEYLFIYKCTSWAVEELGFIVLNKYNFLKMIAQPFSCQGSCLPANATIQSVPPFVASFKIVSLFLVCEVSSPNDLTRWVWHPQQAIIAVGHFDIRTRASEPIWKMLCVKMFTNIKSSPFQKPQQKP